MTDKLVERLRRAFWLPPALGLVLGVALAYGLSVLDTVVEVDLGLFSFDDRDAARGALSTLATATLSVAGITFSVTLVALQLASSQLSPRVLTTFREDRLTQITLGAFLGTFAYALVLLGRLEEDEGTLPELSLSIAMLAALGALALFVAFIGRTVASLQASTVIRRIADDGRRAVRNAHPRGLGRTPRSEAAAGQLAAQRTAALPARELRAREGGFVLHVDGAIVGRASAHDALVVQRALVGDLVVPHQVVASVHVDRGVGDEVLAELEGAFAYGEERTMTADAAFPVRALADVALRALSPSTNDPTTAENALGAVVATILEWLDQDPVFPIRVDEEEQPRFVALAPALDDLVVLGFEQARLMIEGEHPLLATRCITWLEIIEERGRACGHETAEVRRQVGLLEPTAARAPG